MKHKIIICIALLLLSSWVFAQNATPVAEPTITEIKIPNPPESKEIPTTTAPITKPDIQLQLKPSNQTDNIALPTTTIDTKIDNSKYYKPNNNLKPKAIEATKSKEVSKALPKNGAKPTIVNVE